MYGTCGELRSWYYGVCLYVQLVPKARNSSFMWHCIMDDEHHKKCKKYEANFAWDSPKWTKMDLKLWEHISNMRRLQKLLLWPLLLSSSTTEVKNNSSLRSRMLENQLEQHGEIWCTWACIGLLERDWPPQVDAETQVISHSMRELTG